VTGSASQECWRLTNVSPRMRARLECPSDDERGSDLG
jgi:hypothetical protein